jgi:hypothetical protein
MYLFLVNIIFFTSYANNCKKHTLFPSITDTTATGSRRGARDLIPIYVSTSNWDLVTTRRSGVVRVLIGILAVHRVSAVAGAVAAAGVSDVRFPSFEGRERAWSSRLSILSPRARTLAGTADPRTSRLARLPRFVFGKRIDAIN